ncbi:MAG: DUF3365 domain-containing protein [Magnetococcales bacterium]|nr:DUF3365 domain-containing protein [Magnetococcales bacterium]
MLKPILLSRKFWVWPVLVWSLVVGLSILWSAIGLNRQASALARERGWFTFQILENVRTWNARHGGVYVPETAKTQPNPYLNVPERDVVTVTGKRLTMINPAYMTRQMAEIAAEKGSMVLHITSLNPLRPANAASAWESRALKAFEQGVSEYLELVRDDGKDLYRFMAPLYVREECLLCHAQQGYKKGDLRGGISIIFPAESILEGIEEQTKNVILLHLGVWALLTGLTLWFLSWVRHHLAQLRRLQTRHETLLHTVRRSGAMSGYSSGLAGSGSRESLFRQRGEFQGSLPESVSPPLVDHPPSDHEQPQVLLVEDDPLNRRMLEALLQGMGIHPAVVKNGQEALDYLAAADYDLVLMDCQMPIMDGYAASREQRQRERASGKRHTPIVAVTSFSLSGDQEKCQSAGMDDYLAKPVCRQDLLDLLDRWLPDQRDSAATDSDTTNQKSDGQQDPPPTIDQRTFALLCSELGGDVVGEVVKLFLETLPERIQTIERGMKSGDAQIVHWATHPLKSPSRQLGALRFSDLATELDTLTRNNSLQGAQLLADQLMKEATRVDAALQELASHCQEQKGQAV